MKFKVYTKEKGLIETDEYNDFRSLTLHREDGPAYTDYYDDGKVNTVGYYVNGKEHRLDGPSDIWYWWNGNINREDYYVNGKQHRLDGPAVIFYDENGIMKSSVMYYINDKSLSFDEWKEHPLVKAKTIEVDSEKKLDALAKKDKEGTKTDDYFISSTGKYPIVYTLKESKVFESFKDKYIKK